jgi:hypothetical protein
METSATASSLLLKRNVAVKVVVTELWKTRTREQVQGQIQGIDGQIQQLEFQGKRAIAEVEKRTIQPAGPEAIQQIESIKSQVNTQKSQLLDRKNILLQQLNQVTNLELNQEVPLQTQLESYCRVTAGDNLAEKLQVEIVIKDDVIEEIRGTLS